MDKRIIEQAFADADVDIQKANQLAGQGKLDESFEELDEAQKAIESAIPTIVEAANRQPKPQGEAA